MRKTKPTSRSILKSERKGIPSYYAAIITRADSGIKTLDDLRGKSFAFGDALSTTGNVFPRKMFKEHGIEPVRDFRQMLYSGGHDATVLAVLNGKVDAGATYANSPDSQDTAWMRYLKNPEDVKKIHAIAFSEPIPADNLVISGSLDRAHREKDRKCLSSSSRATQRKKMLRELYQIDGFVRATIRITIRCARRSSTPAYPLKDSAAEKEPVTILEIRDLHHFL